MFVSSVGRQSAPCFVENLEGRTFLSSSPAVYAPHADVAGVPMSVWAREWLRWALSPSASKSPIIDDSGKNTNMRQPKSVFFLAGTTTNEDPVDRYAYVKPDRPIFLPVLNSFFVNYDAPGGDPPFASNEKNIRKLLHKDVAGYKNVFMTVDGKKVADLSSHVEHDPAGGVTIKFADDNAFGTPPADLGKSATEGIYVMLKPLSPGKHVVHFGGTATMQNFSLDVTYTLNVLPSTPASVAVAAAAKPSAVKVDTVADSILDG